MTLSSDDIKKVAAAIKADQGFLGVPIGQLATILIALIGGYFANEMTGQQADSELKQDIALIKRDVSHLVVQVGQDRELSQRLDARLDVVEMEQRIRKPIIDRIRDEADR